MGKIYRVRADIAVSCLSCTAVRVFDGPRARGDIATCFILDADPAASDAAVTESQWKIRNAQSSGETWCLIWKERERVRVIALRHGHEIRFCGHGLVAAGYCWFLHSGELALLATPSGCYATRRACGALGSNDLPRAGDTGEFAIAAPRIALREISGNDSLQNNALKNDIAKNRSGQLWFDSEPNGCFAAGGDDDYLLCTWPRGVDIASIQINRELIARQPRAIVMTQCDAAHVSSNTNSLSAAARCFDLRYIAPQYGENEGRATGSAAAIAANYWRIHFQARPGQRFIANQRSAAGGEIHCAVDSDAIWIGGRVSRLFR